ncbi:hypothetical protein BC827DRAFT_876597 [Russula dissimulans]|nr:hypothetical protein BC827DRAFT_876597 [Russula dissimulans]
MAILLVRTPQFSFGHLLVDYPLRLRYAESLRSSESHLASPTTAMTMMMFFIDATNITQFVATDRPIDIALLYHVLSPRVFHWNSVGRGVLDARHIAESEESTFWNITESPYFTFTFITP